MGNGIWYGAAALVVLVVLGFVGYNEGWFDKIIGDEDPCADVECGDGVCNTDCETITTCAADCVDICTGETCGNGNCRAECGETTTSCPADCTTTGGTTYYPPQTPDEPVPVEQLNGNCKNKFTMAAVTDGNFSFYTVGADVSNPYVLELDSVDCGGNSTALVLQTSNTLYDLYYQDNEGAVYYDEKISNWDINYNPSTGKGYLMVGGQAYFGVSPVGAFVDVDTLPETETGCIGDNGTDSINYSIAGCGGSGWWQMDIGNANANTELQKVVMCFRDSDSDMEGNEVTAFTASYVSGSTAISIPGSLQQYWEDAMGGGGAECVLIANLLGSSQKARWQFTMTVAEANFAEGEEFEITFDDLGDYLQKQYPSRNAKATAETLDISRNA